MLTMEISRQPGRAQAQPLDDHADGASPPMPAHAYLSDLPSRLGAFWSTPEAGETFLLYAFKSCTAASWLERASCPAP